MHSLLSEDLGSSVADDRIERACTIAYACLAQRRVQRRRETGCQLWGLPRRDDARVRWIPSGASKRVADEAGLWGLSECDGS